MLPEAGEPLQNNNKVLIEIPLIYQEGVKVCFRSFQTASQILSVDVQQNLTRQMAGKLAKIMQC